jgi:hypothetical protein
MSSRADRAPLGMSSRDNHPRGMSHTSHTQKVAAPGGTATFTVLLQATNCQDPGSGLRGDEGN